MNTEWLRFALLRAASLLAPADDRAEWLREWRSELWYIPRRGATRFCMGAFRDALWVRCNSPRPIARPRFHLDSPLSCLAFLAALAAVSLWIVLLIPPRRPGPWPSHLRVRDLPGASAIMLLYTGLMLPAIRLAMGLPPAHPHPLPWRRRLARAIFLLLKIALLQPVMLCGFFLLLWLQPMVPMAPSLGMFASWILAFRWVLIDQRRRCPVCLRSLTGTVRIGAASETFLEWYGAESMCSRGHGFLHVPETCSSYSGKQQWLGPLIRA